MKIHRFAAIALAIAPFAAFAAADDAGDQGQERRSDQADERSNSQVAPDATRGQDRANEVQPSPIPTRSPSVENRNPNDRDFPARDSGTRRTPSTGTRDDAMPNGGTGTGDSGSGAGGSTGGASGGGSR
jgi:hypothetical protein